MSLQRNHNSQHKWVQYCHHFAVRRNVIITKCSLLSLHRSAWCKYSAIERKESLHSSTCWQSCVEWNIDIPDVSILVQWLEVRWTVCQVSVNFSCYVIIRCVWSLPFCWKFCKKSCLFIHRKCLFACVMERQTKLMLQMAMLRVLHQTQCGSSAAVSV